jgi:23S rRNA (guanosine2251-2'-O)-methyltransferase
VKNYRQQPQGRPKKNTLVIGRQAIIEALKSGQQLERIYLQNTLHGKEIEELKNTAALHQAPINKVPIEKINGFNIGVHDGVVAVISKIQYQDLQNVISMVVESGKAPLLLILDGVTDVRNIGAIARTALCCGVDAIVIPDKGVGALNEDAMLTSAGALEKIPVCRVSSLMKTVDDLHLNGIKVFASEMTAPTSIFSVEFNEPCAIVVGSEDKGIYPPLMKICDQPFNIPMHNNFESLNVSVATGMILYEAMRQRSVIS